MQGVLLLPHTRIQFDLATSRTNGYGLDVDVTLPDKCD